MEQNPPEHQPDQPQERLATPRPIESRPPPQQRPPQQPPRKQGGRGWLIALSIVGGIVLACAILPLGAFALLLASGDNGTASAGGGPALPGMSWNEEVVEGTGTERVLILEVSGPIGVDSGGFGNPVLTQDDILSQIEQATEDEDVRAVVLRVDSPGGGVVASRQIYNALLDLQAADKTLVVSMGTVAASGGYYISAPADKIYAYSDTLTGSLGVILTLLNYEEALDTLGLEQMVFKSGEFKDIGSPVREMTPEEAAILESIIDQAYEGFVDVIVEGRELSRDEVLDLADGRIYTGQQALEAGLLDEIGGIDAAIAGAKELADLPEDALVVRYNTTPSFYDLLVGGLYQAQQPADPLGLRTLREPSSPRLEYRMVP